MNLGAQLGPLSITKLSPNWACQMGPIHFINFAVWALTSSCLLIMQRSCWLISYRRHVEVHKGGLDLMDNHIITKFATVVPYALSMCPNFVKKTSTFFAEFTQQSVGHSYNTRTYASLDNSVSCLIKS